jgi:hypothetical protein
MSMDRYLNRQFREWATSAIRMRDTIKLHAEDAATIQARTTLAREDAAKARFYFQAMKGVKP